MSANTIFKDAPIGAIVAWSDGTPRPPERHRRKLDAWKTSNSQGRLIRKQGGRDIGTLDPYASFTLHEADYGACGVIAIRIHRTFSPGSSLRFTIIERPPVGAVRVFDRPGDHSELVHLASPRTRPPATVASSSRTNETARSIRCSARPAGGMKRTSAGQSLPSPSRTFSRRSSAATRSRPSRTHGRMRGKPSSAQSSHAADWVVVSAITSGQQRGFVECTATTGGQRGAGAQGRRFLVPAAEYEIGRFGFVIDPDRHAVYAGPTSFVGWRGRGAP